MKISVFDFTEAFEIQIIETVEARVPFRSRRGVDVSALCRDSDDFGASSRLVPVKAGLFSRIYSKKFLVDHI